MPPRASSPAVPGNAFDALIVELTRLPGVGQRSAQRIAFHLIQQPPESARSLAEAIHRFTQDLKVCSICGHVSEADPCPICGDPDRDRGLVLVVEQPTDVATMETLGMYRGVYHVLHGRLSPLEGVGPGDLNVQRLLDRVDAEDGRIREVIVGTNPTIEGDGTALYLTQQLEGKGIAVTRLARGLPTGSHLGGVSKAVLADALHGRRADF